MLRSWLRDQGVTSADRGAVRCIRGEVSSFDILDPDIRDLWADRLREIGASVLVLVLVLDCLAPILDALGLSEDKEWGQFLVALDELAKAAGVEEILLIHHMGHNGERARDVSRLRDWPDVEWKLTREKPDDEDNPAARRYFSAFDHIISLWLGGPPLDRANCRLAHRRCNTIRSNEMRARPRDRGHIEVDAATI